MAGLFIDVAAGRGYLAVPESGSGPGLVLFHDTMDDDEALRDLGELYTAEGYVVLCPGQFVVAKGARTLRRQ
jgi:carboxymethylenebutenolidase